MTERAESWRPIYDGVYEVSDRGNVRRLRAGKGARIGQSLALCFATTGYPVVSICINGDRRVDHVHRLVAQAFIGPPNGLMVNHIDGNKRNNRIENLEYVTREENAAHAGRIGLVQSGDRHWIRRKKANNQ